MDELRLRDAVAGDLPQIVAIYNATIEGRRATADLELVSVDERQAWFDRHGESRPLWVLATEDGTIAAWLSFEDFYGRRAYDRTAEVSIYVAETHQRRGLATRLLSTAIERAPGLGVAVLLGFVFAHNAPSLRLFGSHGFERWAQLPRVALLDDAGFELGSDEVLAWVGARTDAA